MKVFLDCVPCMLRQVLEASRMATKDVALQEDILMEALYILSNYKQYESSPKLAMAMHEMVKEHTNDQDPYRMIKQRDIKAALEMYPFLKSFLHKKDNDLYWALKIAATGNIIDSAMNSDINIEQCVESELEKEFSICDIDSFKQQLDKAKTLLIIGDNSGETVFDRVLVEHLLKYNVSIIYAVRDKPIINDATAKEAYDSGLYLCADIMSTGCSAPGAILSQCSKEFIDVFNSADLIISKGQGNYEALSDCGTNIFFLLKAKCSMISSRFNVKVNEYVFKEHRLVF